MNEKWEEMVVSPEEALAGIKPGMNIFVGTGFAEPRTLLKHIMDSEAENLQDLELTQLVSFGDAISPEKLRSQKYRLKTFFSGWSTGEAITEGLVDLIPCRFGRISRLFASGQVLVDAAFVQITPPYKGYASLGVSVDVARHAMEQASLVIGEVNPVMPHTFGDTFVPISDFDMLVRSTEPPLSFKRWNVDEDYDQVADNIASLIEDKSCIAFSIGPLFDALSQHLTRKKCLGIHSPFFTDALMHLVKSGAVTNRYKEVWKGRSLASYAFGTAELMDWLDRNPLVEFQEIDKVFDPIQIGRNPKCVTVLPARKVDLSGRITLPLGKEVATGPGEVMDFFNGAGLSAGGRTIFGLTSRNIQGENNIRISVEGVPNQFILRESVDMVITEYGIANLSGHSIRERAQALIDIAHPDDRPMLIEQAKDKKIIYQDQIFFPESARLYPSDIQGRNTFKNGLDVRFRAIKPSDEEDMRRLFYRFSDKSVYYRYFSPIKTMPHAKMQEYVNVDYRKIMSIVGLIGTHPHESIIAEARYTKIKDSNADVAFIVDEKHQGKGIATYLYKMLARLAKERGLKGFTANVLASNKAMLKVFERGGLPIKTSLEYDVYEINAKFD